MTGYMADRLVRFTPVRRDDIRPAALPRVDGDPFTVRFVGTMDEGAYDGQEMWLPVDGPLVGWIPACDLTDADLIR